MYRVIVRKFILEGICYLGYGIKCPDRNVEDITTDYKRLAALVKLWNELELEPIHINNVVEDFLCE